MSQSAPALAGADFSRSRFRNPRSRRWPESGARSSMRLRSQGPGAGPSCGGATASRGSRSVATTSTPASTSAAPR